MTENTTTTTQHFFGVYLLYCTNPEFKGRTYIGYTVDPNRRIKQHNKGTHAGGAKRTSNKGPWSMVMIVHGFPNDVCALRFEWAWQHPHRSRRLNHVQKKKSRETRYDYSLRIVAEMLRVGPWNRLPLTIRWVNDEYAREFPVDKVPPLHMPICHGPVLSNKIRKTTRSESAESTNSSSFCTICFQEIESKPLSCINPNCDITTHMICLAELFVDGKHYIPIEGTCPRCNSSVLWGDLIRKYKGCYDLLNDIVINTNVTGDLSGSDSE